MGGWRTCWKIDHKYYGILTRFYPGNREEKVPGEDLGVGRELVEHWQWEESKRFVSLSLFESCVLNQLTV